MKILTLCCLFSLSVGAAYAQVDSTNQTAPRVLVETKDGSQYVGRLIKQDKDQIILRTESVGVLEIPLANVENIQFIGDGPIDTSRPGIASTSFANPNPHRYLFFPSAFTLERGELMYQNTYLFLNSLGVGITDNFSISGGLEFLSLLNGGGTPLIYIAPKVSAPLSENFRLGVGGAYVTVPGNGGGGLGLLYGVGTLGNRDRNATIGLGYAVSQEALDSSSPLIAFSGMLRVGRRLSLITENWILPGETDVPGLLSVGLRIMGQDIAGDIAFLIFPSEFDTVVIPYLSLAVKF